MRNDHNGDPDAGSRIDGGPGTLARGWADLGARSRDPARELDPPPLAPWTLERQRSWTLVCAAPDGGFRRVKKLFRVSSADGSSNKSARPVCGTWIPDSGSTLRFSNENWLGPDSRFRIYDFRTKNLIPKIHFHRPSPNTSTVGERALLARTRGTKFRQPPHRSKLLYT